jgi:hypothetical protein
MAILRPKTEASFTTVAGTTGAEAPATNPGLSAITVPSAR